MGGGKMPQNSAIKKLFCMCLPIVAEIYRRELEHGSALQHKPKGKKYFKSAVKKYTLWLFGLVRIKY